MTPSSHLARRRAYLAFMLSTGVLTMVLFSLLYRPQLSSEGTLTKEGNRDGQDKTKGTAEAFIEKSFIPYNSSKNPDVTWIMSFGGSGTSYTILNTEQVTGTTTASNYGADYDPCIPLRPGFTQGPWIRSPNKPYPDHFILTKTHCGGYCMDCSPVTLSPDAFEEACLTGKRGDKQSVTYDRKIPKKAIHLIRNPLDNLVGRMHLFNKHHRDRVPFETSRGGLAAWCKYLDDKYPVDDAFRSVPCQAEWFRYVQWHNLAWETTRTRLQIPVHYLYYDQYASRYNETLRGVLDFLQLSAVSDPLPFHAGKTYQSLFGISHMQAAARAVKESALPEVWKLLEPYFAELNVVEDADDYQSSIQEKKSHVEADLAGKKPPQVAWLLSYPNSGTSYTISNTEQMSGATTASNYARDWGRCVGVRPELNDQGPFLHFPDMSVPPYVLTKTHCTAYCDDCSPSRYVMSNTTAFEEGCLSGSKKDGEVVTDTTYSVTVPVKAVHLIRSPFDNIVSRMHLGVKRRRRQGWNEEDLAKFMNGKDGFHTWCRYIEDKYVKQETSTSRIDEETKRLFEGVPCHADIFRYVQWHNLAIQVLEKQDIPVHVLHYESYSTDYNATVDRLFEFLELEKKHKPLPFVAGKTYLSYYSDEEARRTSKLVRAVASPATWALVKHYFEPWNPHT